MKTHKLLLDDIFIESFLVLAIYSDEKDYRMAYLLNKYLNIQLHKSTSVLDKKKGAEFCVFEYEDKALYRNWFLINNYCFLDKEVNYSHDLFAQNTSLFQQKSFYIKKLKSAHYILKVEVEYSDNYAKELLQKIQNIPQIYATELVDLKLLKNKELLIF